jgi:LPS-assembly lipoprotein
MSLFKKLLNPVALIAGMMLLASCTVTPLETSGNISATGGALSGVTFADPDTRTAQKLRNALVDLAGGENATSAETATVEFSAEVTQSVREVATRRGTARPGIGQITVSAFWKVTEIASGTVLGTGTLAATASIDQFTQEFGNQEARRDAETRAAKELAQRLRPLILRAKAKAGS